MLTKEQHLENMKNEKINELENSFNNTINRGSTFTYGSNTIQLTGGKEVLNDINALQTYYELNNITDDCKVRDSVNKTTLTGNLNDFRYFVKSVLDWGVELRLKLMDKQDYIQQCTTVEQVLDVTWDSVE